MLHNRLKLNKDKTELGLCYLHVFFELVFIPFPLFRFLLQSKICFFFVIIFFFRYGVRTRVLQEHQLSFLTNSVSIQFA